ncbi:MAG: tRNA nucleotidyltransferase [Clostridia bacterium]|nr:tRNA nucleotidyltransferase [Clostridia bacterium]
MAKRLAEKVSHAGGRVYYVGGFVRDQVLGRDNKDVDVEVHGITPKQLEEILDSLGQRTVMGASFGIYGLRHLDLDIAMPRSEHATGRGHKDFDVFVDPFLGPEKAAMRRDFTFNALMQDVLTGEILDFFGGVQDLKTGVLRHVNDDTFQEDPLRVLRAAQFAARFEFRVAPETIRLCKKMDLTYLASERIMEELSKGLMKSKSPDIFFRVLKEMDQLETWFPNVSVISKDGARFEKAMRAIKRAAGKREGANSPLGFMLSSLACHFEADTAEERASAAEEFLTALTNEAKLHKYVRSMALLSDQPHALYAENALQIEFMRLFDHSESPEDLIMLSEIFNESEDSEREDRLVSLLSAYRMLMAEPQVRGEDLIKNGIKPGKAMGRLIAFSHDLHLSGIKKEEALSKTLEFAKTM